MKCKCPVCGTLKDEIDWYAASIEKLGWHEVTLWYSMEPNGWSFNHTDSGHITTDKPIGKFPHQTKAWEGKKWTKRHCYGDAKSWPMVVMSI